MNYVILIGIALFFLASAIRDGAMGWDFRDGPMNFRITDGDYTLRVRGEGDIDLAPDGSGVAALLVARLPRRPHDAQRHGSARRLHEPRRHDRTAVLPRRRGAAVGTRSRPLRDRSHADRAARDGDQLRGTRCVAPAEPRPERLARRDRAHPFRLRAAPVYRGVRKGGNDRARRLRAGSCASPTTT